jgi:hypothetical protein
MNAQDGSYMLARAEEEIQSAQRSADPKAVSAHFRLAELYLDAVYGADDPRTKVIDGAAPALEC